MLPCVQPSASAGCSRTLASQAGPSGLGDDASNQKSRKRVRKVEEWKSYQRKAKRNRGEAYVSKTGKEVWLCEQSDVK